MTDHGEYLPMRHPHGIDVPRYIHEDLIDEYETNGWVLDEADPAVALFKTERLHDDA